MFDDAYNIKLVSSAYQFIYRLPYKSEGVSKEISFKTNVVQDGGISIGGSPFPTTTEVCFRVGDPERVDDMVYRGRIVERPLSFGSVVAIFEENDVNFFIWVDNEAFDFIVCHAEKGHSIVFNIGVLGRTLNDGNWDAQENDELLAIVGFESVFASSGWDDEDR
ncbi:hypothetical protein [Prosthecomicrobium sp. N25]|uniref:hypothetical protein n=1 Tax=Prosthecomicrobium sp. N25 TaxID=3129254 RepID=UPI003078821B